MMGLTGESDGPISSSAVGEVTGNGTKGITEKFAGGCRNADGRRGRTKRTHELPVDASAALAGDVGEQVDAAHDQLEGRQRPPKPIWRLRSRLAIHQRPNGPV